MQVEPALDALDPKGKGGEVASPQKIALNRSADMGVEDAQLPLDAAGALVRPAILRPDRPELLEEQVEADVPGGPSPYQR